MTIINDSTEGEYIEKASKAGLSSKASKVYVCLLDYKNPLAPKGIIAKTNLHRQYVYDALHELRGVGLVLPVGKGRAIQYIAASPDKLLQDVEKKRMDTLDGVQKLLELYNTTPAGLVEIISGKIAVCESEWRILESMNDGDYLDIIGGAGTSFLDLMSGTISEYEKLHQEKNIKFRYITSRSDTQYLNASAEGLASGREIRYLENINDSINLCIRPGSVSFNIYDPEVMVLRVKSEAAVISQRALFEILWSVAST